jgi:nicotinamide-nucleotide adenylyltransferase
VAAPVHQRHPNCLRLSVLDSSFNPPTFAHAALARLGPPKTSENPGSISSSSDSYDAHLLLLSITNADKTPKPGDAGLEQRLEMMLLLADELQSSEIVRSTGNIAVAAIDEPTFVGKARRLRQVLLTMIRRTVPVVALQLHFVLGFDTVVRLFSPRFYASQDAMCSLLETFFDPTGDNCVVVCARRSLKEGMTQEERDLEEREFVESIEVRRYIETGRVVLVDIPEDLQAISSTKVRKGGRDLVPLSIRSYIGGKNLYTCA